MPRPEPFELPPPGRTDCWNLTAEDKHRLYVYDIALSLRRLVELLEIEQRRK